MVENEETGLQAYLELYLSFMKDIFGKNSKIILTKTPSWIFDMILNTPLRKVHCNVMFLKFQKFELVVPCRV